jgi:hypothetical protein
MKPTKNAKAATGAKIFFFAIFAISALNVVTGA